MLSVLGHYDEAAELGQLARERGLPQNLRIRGNWQGALARVQAHRGDLAEAEQLAREAVATAEQTDSLNYQGKALIDLGEVLAAAGRQTEASAAFDEAIARFAGKGNVAMVAQAEARRSELLAGATV